MITDLRFAVTAALFASFGACQFEQQISQCKELEHKIQSLDLSKCSEGLEQCLVTNFSKPKDSCNVCVRVSGDLQTEENCDCIECIINVLHSTCFPQFCSDNEASKMILEHLNEEIVEYAKTATPVVVENKELQYFVDGINNDDDDQIRRVIFDKERQELIHSFLANSKYHVGPALRMQKRDFPCDQVDCERLDALIDEQTDEVQDAKFWRKKKKEPEPEPEPEDGCGDDVCTTTYVSTSYKPKKRIMTSWKPIKITITETLTGEGCNGKVITKTLWDTETQTETQTETETHTETKWKWKKEHTITATATSSVPVTKIIFKHDKATVTETEFEVSTKTKFKHDKATVTETELEEVTKTKKIAVDTTTMVKWKTETEWDTTTKIKKKTIPTTITSTTSTTKTKTTTVSTVSVTTTTASKAKMPLLSGLGFDLLNADSIEKPLEYIVGYTTSGVSNSTTNDLKNSLDESAVRSTNESTSLNSTNSTTTYSNDTETLTDEFESSSSMATDASKSWIVSTIAASVGLLVIFGLSEGGHTKSKGKNIETQSTSEKEEQDGGALDSDFEMDTEEFIDSDIHDLITVAVPHAEKTKRQMAAEFVDDPLKNIPAT